MDLESYYFDKYVNKQLKKTVFLFKYIHPNAITIFGIIINLFMIYYYYILHIKDITAILLLIRITCDNLDGMVAREFKKISKLGGLLDSLADSFLLMTIWYGFFNYFIGFRYSLCTAIIFGCGMLWYLIVQDALFVHKNFEKDTSIVNKFIVLIAENTYTSALLIILIIYMI